MKNTKTYITLFCVSLSLLLTACFDEKEDEYQLVGAVGTISVLTPSNSKPVAGEQVTIKVRYYSENIEAREIRLFETINNVKTQIGSKEITDFDIKDSYEDVFNYTIPAVPAKTTIVITAEIETVNDLVNSKTSNIVVQ